MTFNIPTPLVELQSSIFSEKKIRIWLKRDDLTHPQIQGNKLRKLKYNIEAFRASGKKYLLTFGGAYSNHIHATAATGEVFGIPTIGIIRGEKILPLNPTLAFAEKSGMQLYFVNRTSFKQKENLPQKLNINSDDCFVLPEGGTNSLALKGCSELAMEIVDQMTNLELPSPDFVCVSCGTGGTAAGIISAQLGFHTIGFSSLKGDFLKKEIEHLLPKNLSNWSLQTNYHFGGYAKFAPELIEFINNFKKEFCIQLDPVYTGKMLFGLIDLINKDHFAEGTNIVAIHTGGLQGIAGFNERFDHVLTL